LPPNGSGQTGVVREKNGYFGEKVQQLLMKSQPAFVRTPGIFADAVTAPPEATEFSYGGKRVFWVKKLLDKESCIGYI